MRIGRGGENWVVMLDGRNVCDKMTPQGAFDVPLADGAHAQHTQPGSVWGATLSYNF